MKLSIIQTSKKVEKLRQAFFDSKTRNGWVQLIRTSLGMKSKTLAERMGLAPNTITEMEKREVSGQITINTLKKLAEAMESEFVYAIIPKKTLEETLKENAKKKALTFFKSVDTHMSLEDQQVTTEEKERLDRLIDELIEKGDVW